MSLKQRSLVNIQKLPAQNRKFPGQSRTLPG